MPQYKAPTCRRVGPLSDRARDRLPDKAFGIPSERKYPMPDPQHAANAKGRAKTALKRGEVTRNRRELAACKLRNRCSSRRGQREGDCVRACKASVTRRRA